MKKHAPFTLIELLAVIGIMILIMTLAIPGFQRLVTGNAVDVSARMVTGQLALARAAAIAEHKYVALVFPSRAFDMTGATELDANSTYAHSSFRAAYVRPSDAAGKFTLEGWYPNSTWAFLPRGAAIASVDARSSSQAALSAASVDGSSALNSTYYGSYATTRVINGTTTSLTGNDDKNKAYGTGITSYPTVAIVFNPQGFVCDEGNGADPVERRIVIVEANGDSTGVALTQTADETQTRVIKIVQYTGKAEYEN